MLTAVALALTLNQSAFTYDHPISTVTEALAAIAKETGKTVEHTGIGHLPILIKVKDVSPKELLEKIARVTDASFVETSTGYRLDRSPSRIQAERAASAAETSKRLKEAIDAKKSEWIKAADWSDKALSEKADKLAGRLEEVLKNNPTSADMQTDVQFGNVFETPASLVLAKLLTSAPVATWMPDSPGGVLRLSDKPNRYQRKLPIDLTSAYRDYANAAGRMRTVLNARVQMEGVNVGMGSRDFRAEDVSRTVVLANWTQPGWVVIAAYILDSQGNVIGRSSASLTVEQPVTAKEASIASDTVISVPKETNALAKALLYTQGSGGGGQNAMQMRMDDVNVALGTTARTMRQPDSVLDRLCAERDPFEDIAAEPLRTLAAEQKKNLVATLPERFFRAAVNLNTREKFSLTDFGKALAGAEVDVAADGNWLVVNPAFFAQLDQTLTNRAGLYKLSRSLRNQAFASLDQTGSYLLSRYGRIDSNSIDYAWIRALNAPAANEMMQEQAALRLYAGLPAEIKKTNAIKAPVSGNLLPAVASRLDSHVGGAQVFGQGVAISRYSGNPRSNWIGQIDISEPLALGLVSLDYRMEDASTLFVKRNSEGAGRFMKPAEIGVYRLLAKQPKYAEFNSDLMPYDTFQKARSRRIHMYITYSTGPNSWNPVVMDEVEDNQALTDQGKWTWETLPAEIKNQISEAEKKYEGRIGR